MDDDYELLFRLLGEPVFLAIAGGLLLVLTIVAVVVGRRVWRRLRRFAGANAHLVERARAELHTRTLQGPARTAAELRARLAAAVTETDRVVAAAAGHALVSATLAEQHHELGRLAAGLDRHLLGLTRDPEPARVQAALPEAQRWTEQLCEVAGDIRENVRASAAATRDSDVRALGDSTADGVAGLRAGIDFLQAQVRQPPDREAAQVRQPPDRAAAQRPRLETER